MTSFNDFVDMKRVMLTCKKYENSFVGQGPNKFTDLQMLIVLYRDKYMCSYCGNSNVKARVYHIKPWSSGGHTRINNAISLCLHCNGAKGKRTGSEFTGRVYLLKDGSLYKIGFTGKSFAVRLEQIKRENPNIKPIMTSAIMTLKNAIKLESDLHRMYKSVRVHSEWFKLTVADVKAIKRMLK